MKVIPIVRLHPRYARFCVFETAAINGVGCTTLVFQDQLRESCPYPGLYDYWFSGAVPATETEHLMSFMIAAWLATAGLLQAVINFDERVPLRTKMVALFGFALCDAWWIVLMTRYTALFSAYHIVGSIYTILQRFTFVLRPNDAFILGNYTGG